MNSYTIFLQVQPAVASDADGDFVVAWAEPRGAYDSGVFVQRYASSGVPKGAAFQVTNYTTIDYTFPEVFADSDGDFVVAWAGGYVEASYRAVRAKRYDSSGTEQFALVLPGAAEPAVSGESNGDFVLVWSEETKIGYSAIFGQLYQSTGALLGTEFHVSSDLGLRREYDPSVAADADGDFVVVWENRSNFARNVLGRRFASSGAPLGQDFPVSALTEGYEYAARVSSDPAGNFVVAWNDIIGDVGDFIRTRGFASDGAQRFPESPIAIGAMPCP